jgi:arylsulfatase A-like enzyme
MKKPNIIFILIDDMGWKDLGCFDSSFYETPNIDRIASEGMRFTDAYASCPVCSPTRASIMSGKYPATVGVTNWIGGNARGKLLDSPYTDHLPVQEKSIAKALKEEGYHTWHVGKWHLGKQPEYFPEQHGFDVNKGGCGRGSPKNGYFSPYGIETLTDGPEGEYLTDRLTNEAIQLLKHKAKSQDSQPFFLNLSHYTVHTPIQAKLEDIAKYEKKAKKMKLDQLEIFEEGEYYPTEHKREKRVQRRRVQSDPVYAAMIDNLDQNIGRLMETLHEIGEADNTIMFFTSDNGGLATSEGSPTCNFPLHEGKGWMYEGGVRVPLFVKWPGVTRSGEICNVPVTSPDYYPTMLEMAGLDLNPEQHKDGVSIVPLLRGGGKLEREAIYWHYPHYGNQGGTPGSSIRLGDYKLIEFFEDGSIELYNLREDIHERNDLSKQEAERAEKMKGMLASWRESADAKIPEQNPDHLQSEM